MKMRTIGPSLAVRTASLLLTGTLIAGCSTNNRLLPAVAPGAPAIPGALQRGATLDAAPDGRTVETFVRIRIPRRAARRAEMHPSTISSSTMSVSIVVNGTKAQIFNTTPLSPGCIVGSKGTTCTFKVAAKSGTDTFTVTTYSGLNATGSALDRGAVTVPITKGKANSVAVTLGPVVTTTANTGPGSLRFAVASANAGDTIMFLLAKGATITLTAPIVLTGTLTIAGPGATSVAISGGNAHQLFQIAGTATISGLTLEHGKAAVSSNPGGTIENEGTLTLINDVFGSSTSVVSIRRAPARGLHVHGLHPHCSTTPNEGGAIYNNGALTISGTMFTGNAIRSNVGSCIVGEGGAIFNDLAGTVSSSHDTYSGNAAALGGAVYNAGIGAVTFTNDTFSGNTGCTASNGCPTTGCGATSCTSNAVGEGAAIYDDGLGITVTGSTFNNNVAGGKTPGSIGQGGALYLNSTFPTITTTTFTGNLAGGGTSSCSAGQGGAIFAAHAMEIDNDTFQSNTASGDMTGAGGAIASADNVTGTGDKFTGNTSKGLGGPCTTSAQGVSGAVLANTATFTNSTFSGNSTTGQDTGGGGAIGGLAVIVTGSTFTSNTALATGGNGATSATGVGGAIYCTTLGKVSNSTFTSNSATAQSAAAQAAAGGAIGAGGGSLISTGNTFTSNSVTLKGTTQTGAGGAILVESGTLVSTGDKFTSNSATATLGTAGGGAVIVSGSALINNATMTANKVNGAMGVGAAIALGSSPGILKHVVATGNTATGTTLGGGGGLYDGSGAQISDSTFSNNSVTNAGGGIMSVTTAETILDSTIDNNVVTAAKIANAGGGGIYDSSGVALSQVTIAGNSVTVSGPGPAGGGGILNTGGILMVGSTISGNKVLGTAPHSGGGGVFSGSAFDAVNSTMSSNSSSVDAGGLFNAYNSGVSFANVTFFGNAANAATGHGGNIYNYTSAAMTLTNSVIGGGTAKTGADIDNLATISSGGYNILQTAPVGAALTGTLTGNLVADPKLLALSNNGGPTFTNADTSTSPGKQHIPFAASSCGSVSINADQRGFTRGSGGHCDSGAYEYAGIATAIAHRPLARPAFRHRAMLGAGAPLLHVKIPKIDVGLLTRPE